MHKKTSRLIIFVLFPVIASFLSFFFKLDFCMSIFIFLGLPSVYLSFVFKNRSLNAAKFAFIVCIPPAMVVDYILSLNGQWHVTSVFPDRILEFITIENLMWGFLYFYFVVMFYEYFLGVNKNTGRLNSNMNTLSLLSLSFLITFLIVYFFLPSLLYIPYAYFWIFLSISLLPTIAKIVLSPELLPKLLPIGLYFFFYNMIYEITALKLGWWSFPSTHYISIVSLFGVAFPFEELFFYIFLLAITITCFYEFSKGVNNKNLTAK